MSAPDSNPQFSTLDELRLLDDDPRAWTRLVDRLASQLRVLARFRMTAAARATCDEEDLVQEVLSALVEHRHRFVYGGPGSLRRWAAGILRHKIADAGRRRTALPASLLSPRTAKGNGSSVPGGLIDALVASQAGASHVALKRELEDKVSAVLESLSDDLREVLLLKMYEELSGREIAQQLSLDESTISKRIRRALETCRSRLGEDAA